MTKCEGCGRFVGLNEMAEGGGARFRFEPATHFGPEVSEWTCKRCAESPRLASKGEQRRWKIAELSARELAKDAGY